MAVLVVRWTAALALAVTAAVTALGAASGAPWPLLAARAGMSIGIVALLGWAIGSVLMRTALRRLYEQGRAGQAGPRPRAHR